jgi:hypothetical protein
LLRWPSSATCCCCCLLLQDDSDDSDDSEDSEDSEEGSVDDERKVGRSIIIVSEDDDNPEVGAGVLLSAHAPAA